MVFDENKVDAVVWTRLRTKVAGIGEAAVWKSEFESGWGCGPVSY